MYESCVFFGIIQWASYRFSPTIENMRINHGGADVFVSQKVLHSADIITVGQQVGGEAVSQSMATNRFYEFA